MEKLKVLIVGFFDFKSAYLFHPESPGVKVKVTRSWIGRLLKPTAFTTLSEVLKSNVKYN